MTRYFFHVDNGTSPPTMKVSVPHLEAARLEAVRAAWRDDKESKQSFWEHMTPWIMNVTDDEDHLLFTPQFVVPSLDISRVICSL
ncbi:hypothetical protein FJV76_13720 [Mesorhizobium sp. WSM4303]|uniref:DUF6894 family protein n=2 Tax=unclassified Mesorhizobium TaxID=325217 RepID=UPI001169F62D|nr:hypothetical protein [Mesorhizobium sp. WSM4303]TRD04333.1 hypothetical protein FJV76_13720 [Mesorhizobium sp. WSM4303]